MGTTFTLSLCGKTLLSTMSGSAWPSGGSSAQAPGYLRSTPCRIIQVLMCSPSRRILDASPDLKFQLGMKALLQCDLLIDYALGD